MTQPGYWPGNPGGGAGLDQAAVDGRVRAVGDPAYAPIGTAGASPGVPAWAANWFAALANRALAPAVIAGTGSSTLQGYVASSTLRRALSRMAQQLQSRYTPGQNGFHARALDTGYVTTGGVTSATVLAGACGRQVYALPNAATLSRTDTCTGFRVFYGQGPGAGGFTVSVDGSVVATITPDTSGNARSDGVWSSATLTRGSHTLLITATAAGALVEGVYVFDGDNTTGLWTLNDGHAGAAVSDFTSTGPGRLVQQGVGLYVLIPGATEYGANLDAATFKTNLLALIAQRRNASPLPASFLIVGTFPRPDKGPTGWTAYLTAMREISAAFPADVGFVDLSQPFPTVSTGNADPFNLIADGDIHLTDRGHQMFGDLLAAAVISATERRSDALAGTSSAGVIGADTTAPTITSFTGTPGNTQNVLAWSATDNVAVTRYTIARGGTTILDTNSTGMTTAFTDTGRTNGTAYTYTLTAYDAAGNTATQNVTATPTSGAYDPTQLSGLQAWYDPGAITGTSDGAAVTSWPDKSSNSFTATNSTAGERPTYTAAASELNGKPAVTFAGAQRLLSALAAGGTPFTVVLSFAIPSGGTGNRTIFGSSASGGRQVRIGGNAGQFFGALVNQGTAVIAQQSAPNTGLTGVLTVAWDGTTLTMRTNGTVVATSGPTASAFTGSPTTVIGSKDTAAGDPFVGKLGDLVQVSRVLTSTEMQTEERRQGTKYGITVA